MASRIMSCVSRCRVCFTEQGDLQSLFLKNKGCSPYDKLTSVLKISISLDSYSKFICFTCMSELDIAVNFITKFQKADAFLKDLHKRKQEHKLYIREQSRSPNEIQCDGDDTSLVVRKHNVDIFDVNVQKRSSKNFSTVGENKQKKQCPKLLSCTECVIQDNCGHYAVLKPHSCNICGKKFNKKDNLIVHIKRHSGERDWGCEVCGARHYTAGELKAHCRTHAGERPFACNSCPKRFTARTNLRIHQRIHTGKYGYLYLCYTMVTDLKNTGKVHKYRNFSYGPSEFNNNNSLLFLNLIS